MRRLRKQDCKDDGKRREVEQWPDERNEEGRITSLELYIWWYIHARTEEQHPLEQKDILQKEISSFKQLVRLIAIHAVEQDQEWQLQTCYGR